MSTPVLRSTLGEGDGHTCSVGLYAPLSVTLEQRLLGGV